jgi:hypothetical protein
MSAQMLVQRQNEEAQASVSVAGIQILETRINSMSISRARTGGAALKGKPFDFEVNLNEMSRSGDKLLVGYSFSFGKLSSGQVCKMSGQALVRFTQFGSEKDYNYLGEEITNDLAVEIFRRNYEATYLLHESVGMDAPSPWITQDVSLSQVV